MTTMFDVLVIGNYSLDLVFTGMPAMPALGTEVYARGFEMLPGETYNSAVGMHRLGLKVGWAGDFGNDDFSRFVLQRLAEEGLDSSLFVQHARPLRRISVAASFPEDRAFLTYYDPKPPVPAAIKALAKAQARALFIPGFFSGPLFDTGVKVARLKGMKVVMDGNSGGGVSLSEPGARRAVEQVDVLLPNAREARCLTGLDNLPAALHMLAKICPLVVVKDGPNGAYACQGGEIIHVPGIPVTPVDTTGAGDLFCSGFLKAWLGGLPLRDCLRWGNVVGGLSTLAAGGTGRVITVKDVEPYLAT